MLLLLVGLLVSDRLADSASATEGVALAVLYDTSGSMSQSVRDQSGKMLPKDVVARRALDALVGRLSAFVTNAPPGSERVVEAALFTFSSTDARELVPLGRFDPAVAAAWSRQIPRPAGGTPLGNAVQTASRAVLKSKLPRKHVLILTDGVNTAGPNPEIPLAALLRQADTDGTPFSVHFIAFDVDARHFNAVKKLGATVLGAANEVQLNTQLTLILEEKILLEAE